MVFPISVLSKNGLLRNIHVRMIGFVSSLLELEESMVPYHFRQPLSSSSESFSPFESAYSRSKLMLRGRSSKAFTSLLKRFPGASTSLGVDTKELTSCTTLCLHFIHELTDFLLFHILSLRIGSTSPQLLRKYWFFLSSVLEFHDSAHGYL